MPLEITATGNIQPVIKAFTDLKKNLKSIKADLDSSVDGAAVDRLTAAVAATEKQIKKLKQIADPIIPKGAISKPFDEIAASKAALDRIASSIEAAGAEALKAGQKFDSLGGRLPLADMDQFSARVKKLKAELASGSKINIVNPNIIPDQALNGLDKLKLKSQTAGNAIIDFGRIIQDAPYALNNFGSIANNFDPLVLSIGRLRAEAARLSAETGRNVTAFQLFRQGLLGPAGIGLGISIVSSLITVFGNKLFSGAEALKGYAKAVKDSNDEAGKSLARVQILSNAISDSTRTVKDRTIASSELSGILKDLNIEMSKEQILNGGVADATKKVTAAIIERAKARAVENRIAEISGEQLDRDVKKLDLSGKLTKAEKERAAINAKPKSSNKDEAELRGLEQFNAIAKVSTLDKQINDLNKDSAAATKEIETLLSLVSDGDLNIGGKTDKGKKDEDLLQKRLSALQEIKGLTKDINELIPIQEEIFNLQVKIAVRDKSKILAPGELEKLKDGYRKELEQAFKQQAIELEAIPKVRFSAPALAEIPKELTDVISKATGNEKITITLHDVRVKLLGSVKTEDIETAEAEVKDRVKQFGENLRTAFKGIKVDLAASLGETLGNVFSSGDIGEALAAGAKQMLSTIGSFMIQIGRYTIEAAIKLEALKKIIAKFAIKNPALAIAGGIALIAAGTALKNVPFDGPKLAAGGITTGPTVAMVGEAGQEAIIPLRRLPELIGRGNSQPVIVGGELRLSGRDLIVFLQQQQRSFNRIF